MKKTQNQRLLSYLKKHRKGITQLEAFTALGICRLSERVRELESYDLGRDWTGYDITRTRETAPSGATVTRYKLAK